MVQLIFSHKQDTWKNSRVSEEQVMLEVYFSIQYLLGQWISRPVNERGKGFPSSSASFSSSSRACTIHRAEIASRLPTFREYFDQGWLKARKKGVESRGKPASVSRFDAVFLGGCTPSWLKFTERPWSCLNKAVT